MAHGPDIAMKLRVGFPCGAVHDLSVDSDATIADLEAAIVRIAEVDLATQRIRLIAAGKLLGDSTARVDSIFVENAFVHCAVSERPPPSPPSRRQRRSDRRRRSSIADVERRPALSVAASPNGDLTVFFNRIDPEDDDYHDSPEESEYFETEHGVALPILRTVDENGELRIIIPSLTLRGFDRLGFSEAEVAAIRRQFRIARGFSASGVGDTDSEVDLEEEEAWLNSTADNSGETSRSSGEGLDDTRILVTNSNEGSNTDFLLGCVCGYMLGVLTLALLLDKNISRRWRVGIVAGVATNCAFGILRQSLYVQGTGFPG